MSHSSLIRVLLVGASEALETVVRSALAGAATDASFEVTVQGAPLRDDVSPPTDFAWGAFPNCLLLAEAESLESTVEQLVRLRRRWGELPILVLSAATDAAFQVRSAVRVMRDGASDYLTTSSGSAAIAQGVEQAVQRRLLLVENRASDEMQRAVESVRRERQLQGFFDFASVAMALVAPAGNFLRVNSALCRLLGYDKSELSHFHVSELVQADDRPRLSAALALLSAEEVDTCEEEVQLRHKNGSMIWASLSLALITEASGAGGKGEVQGFTLHATDIRIRKATEAELQRSERRFQELLAQAPVGIFETDTHGFCRYVNEKWSEVTGVSYRDAIGAGWAATMHPDDRTRVVRAWADAVRDMGEFSMEFRYARADGSVVWVVGRAGPIVDFDGRIMGYLGTLSDITDRQRAEDELRRTTALLRGILDNAPYSVIATSPDGVVREVSQGAERLLGYSKDELIGRTYGDAIHLADEVGTRSRYAIRKLPGEQNQDAPLGGFQALLLAANGYPSNEWTYCRKNGTTFPVELSVNEMKGGDDTRFGYVIVASDITDRRRKNRELVAAKESAERASAAKADFLAKMSHEIRTPMNSVLGMTELLLQTKLTPDQRSHLELVHQSGKGLLHLINDILDFSKVEARRLTLEKSPFDLYESFAVCLRGPSYTARQKGVALTLRFADDVPRQVVGDLHRLRQVLVNLVGNAVKFTSAGEIVVDVASGGVSNSRVTLYLSVKDTGPGVASEEQARIFKAFVQEDTGIARRYGGTGLGLAICSQLVELMDGKIWLESELGVGSTFFVSVTLDVGVPASLPPASKRSADDGVLLIEANATSREVTRHMLETMGYAPLVCSELDDALRQLQRSGAAPGFVRTVVVDVPDWDRAGGVFLDELQRLNGAVGVVCLSAAYRAREQDWNASFVHLVKPVLPEELRQALVDSQFPGSQRLSALQAPVSLPPMKRGNLSVLVAEDNSTNQLVVAAMLQRLGHQAVVVQNGQEALDRMAQQHYDVVLMDLQMPVMGGLEATRRYRQAEAAQGGHRLPIVALTAQAMRGDREECIRAGMDDYLTKPIEMSALAQMLDTFSPDRAPSSRGVALQELPGLPVFDAASQVDFLGLCARIGTDLQSLRMVASLFETDSMRLLGELRNEIEASGAPHKSGPAHTLKGMLRNVCAARAADAAAQLEHSIAGGSWDVAGTQLEMLSNQVEHVLAELKAHSASN